jgi:hypothetical protein
MHHLTLDKTSDPKLKVASLLCDNEIRTDASATTNIPSSPGHEGEKCILSAYQENLG